jgi:hypothetical protein
MFVGRSCVFREPFFAPRALRRRAAGPLSGVMRRSIPPTAVSLRTGTPRSSPFPHFPHTSTPPSEGCTVRCRARRCDASRADPSFHVLSLARRASRNCGCGEPTDCPPCPTSLPPRAPLPSRPRPPRRASRSRPLRSSSRRRRVTAPRRDARHRESRARSSEPSSSAPPPARLVRLRATSRRARQPCTASR